MPVLSSTFHRVLPFPSRIESCCSSSAKDSANQQATFAFEECQNSPCVFPPSPRTRYFIPFLLFLFLPFSSLYLRNETAGNTVHGLPRDTFPPLMDRIEHGFGNDSTLYRVRCSKCQEYA